MAENKENMKVKENSKIPVLKDRLLAHKKKDDEGRDPLKTLSCRNAGENCLAGPSKSASSKPIDTRYVTVRKTNKNEELRRTLEVFKKNYPRPGTEEKEEEKSTQAAQIAPSVAFQTPHVLLGEGRVKRSLKRPNVRLLDSRASAISAKSSESSINPSNCIKETNFLAVGECFDPLNQAYVLDNLKYLQNIEKKVFGEPQIKKMSRCCLINWIINVNGSGGNPAIVQLACWYLDRYLCTNWVSVDRLQLIAATCFWIASKFHGHYVSSRRLVKYSGNAFTENEVVAAEMNILGKLHFQALPVAPQDFVPYLAWCCDQSRTGLIESAAVFLCQCGMMVNKSLAEEYPSVIAAAAVKNAVILLRKMAWLKDLKSCPIYQVAEAKARNLNSTGTLLREAVRAISSVGFEYKAPLYKFCGPPHHISSKIVSAVNFKDVLVLEVEENHYSNKSV